MMLTHYLLVAAIFWSVFCRARHMSPSTPTRYKVQHGAVLLLATTSLPIFGLADFASLMLALAVCIYLWVDAVDWQGDRPNLPPAGKSAPRRPSMDIARDEFRALTNPPK